MIKTNRRFEPGKYQNVFTMSLICLSNACKMSLKSLWLPISAEIQGHPTKIKKICNLYCFCFSENLVLRVRKVLNCFQNVFKIHVAIFHRLESMKALHPGGARRSPGGVRRSQEEPPGSCSSKQVWWDLSGCFASFRNRWEHTMWQFLFCGIARDGSFS